MVEKTIITFGKFENFPRPTDIVNDGVSDPDNLRANIYFVENAE